jgi:hypothetical protein
MIIDLTINKKGGHFTYYCNWCKKIDKEIIDTKKQFFLKLFQIINAERLVLPSVNIADRYFILYYMIIIIRIVLNKKNNHLITHSAKYSRLRFIKMILPKKNLNFYTFSKGLNDKLNSCGYNSHQVIFPNVEEFDVNARKIKIPYEKYIVIWGRSARYLNQKSIEFLSKSSKNYVIINSNFQKNIYPNLFFCNTKSSNEDKFVIQKATLSLIIIDSVSRDYFKRFHGASGILISNIYLKIYTIILGSIPSHSNEFYSFYSQLSDNISSKDFDNKISEIKTNQTFDLNLPKFEDFLH